jgi:hypothetical protein
MEKVAREVPATARKSLCNWQEWTDSWLRCLGNLRGASCMHIVLIYPLGDNRCGDEGRERIPTAKRELVPSINMACCCYEL